MRFERCANETGFPLKSCRLLPVLLAALCAGVRPASADELTAAKTADIGKKAIRVMPALMRDCMAAGQQWGQSLQPELERRLQQRFKKEGIDPGK